MRVTGGAAGRRVPMLLRPCLACLRRHLQLFFLTNCLVFAFFLASFILHRVPADGIADTSVLRPETRWNVSSAGDFGLNEDALWEEGAGFVEVLPNLLFYSAFLDFRNDRLCHVRAVVLLDNWEAVDKADFRCAFRWGPDGALEAGLESPAHFLEAAENHGSRWRGHLLSCLVPRALAEAVAPVEFQLRQGRELLPALLPLGHSIFPQPPALDLTVCVLTPLDASSHGAEAILAFVELHRLLGAQHFVFYASTELLASGSGRRQLSALDFYKAQGLVTLLPFNRSFAEHELWLRGASLAAQDCVYRSMGVSKWLLVLDWDEYLVPGDRAAKGSPDASPLGRLTQHVERNEERRPAGQCFPLGDFPAWEPRGQGAQLHLAPFRRLHRGQLVDRRAGRCLVRPERVFEMGLHSVTRTYAGAAEAKPAPSRMALLHRYSRGNPLPGDSGVYAPALLRLKGPFTQTFSQALNSFAIFAGLTRQ